MNHDEIQGLLGAYALDATSAEEREAVEAHLDGCPSCRTEAAAHRETAATMATGLGGTSPDGLWERIAAATFASGPSAEAVPAPPLGVVAGSSHEKRRSLLAATPVRRLAVGLGAAAACAAVVLASLLGIQVGQLHSQVRALDRQAAAASIATAAASAAAGPHATVTLSAAQHARTATVVVTPSGRAYWLPSKLAVLARTRTYQLWGLVGTRPVSLGLLGPDPRRTTTFRLEAGTSKLMVTAEPAGGVPTPTTAVLVAGSVPTGAVG